MKNYETKDDEKIEKGKAIAHHTLKIMKQDDSDMTVLQELTEDNSYQGEFLDRMSNSSYLDHAVRNYTTSDKEENLRRLMVRMKTKKRRKKIRRISIVASSVAAAVLFLSFQLFTIDRMPEKEIAEMKSVEEIKVPTLMTESGDQIALNHDVKSSELNIEQNDDHKISYKQIVSDTLKQDEYHTLMIPRQCKYSVMLADGTQVILNAGSRLRYPSYFHQDKRVVYLEGEGYFKVSKSEKPFIVSTDKVDIRVYGTEFNINLNKTGAVETMLVTGSVGVTIKNGRRDSEIMMTPNQMFAFDTRTGIYDVTTVECGEYLGWKEGCFKFEHKNLSELTDAIAAWYGVTFRYSSEEIRNSRISANINMKLTIDQVVEILEALTDKVIINEGNNQYMIK